METTTKPDTGASNATNGALMILALAAGAGIAYFANSSRGTHGGSDLRRRAASALESGEDAIDRLRSDFRQRTRGITEKTQSVVSDLPSDGQLVERVRTHVANLVDDAREIAVIARGGVIQLLGSIFHEERDRLLAAVRAVPGVRKVVDGLQTHLSAEGGDALDRPSPSAQVARSLGTALLVLGLAKRGRAIPAAFLGAGILARSLAQAPQRR